MNFSTWELEEADDEEEEGEEEYPEAGELLYVRWEDLENGKSYIDFGLSDILTEDGAYIDSTIDSDLYENYYEN